MAPTLIALGGNLAAHGRVPEDALACALDLLEDDSAVAVRATSRFYRTPAFPAGSGPDFVNAAASVESGLAPEALLATLHAVEARLGRVRDARWGPRMIDLDLIAVGGLVRPDLETEATWRGLRLEEARTRAPDELVLPHPRMSERGFVLVPLAELAPDWRHPALGLTVRQMVAALDPGEWTEVQPLPARPQVLRAAELGPGRASGVRQTVEILRLPGEHGVTLRFRDEGGEPTETWHAFLVDALRRAEAESGSAIPWRTPLRTGVPDADPA